MPRRAGQPVGPAYSNTAAKIGPTLNSASRRSSKVSTGGKEKGTSQAASRVDLAVVVESEDRLSASYDHAGDSDEGNHSTHGISDTESREGGSNHDISYDESEEESEEESGRDAVPAEVTLDQIDAAENMFVDGSLMADVTGKMAVISLLHNVYWAHEVEIEPSAAEADESGRCLYLLGCRKHQARPIIPALMMMSGTTLLLHNNGMQAADARAIAMGLSKNTCLTDVNLGENVLGDGCMDLAKALVDNKSVKKLVLKQVAAGWRGGEELARTLNVNKSITHLDLRANKIGDRACSEIFEALLNNGTLKHLDLADNQIGSKSVQALSESLLHNVSLTSIDLSWNHVRARDLKVLCPALADNSFVKVVSLAWNGIGHTDTSELAAGATKGTAGKKGAVVGGMALVDLIRTTHSITELDISNCRLGAALCLQLASAIQSNTTLRHMQLDGNPMGSDAAEVLKQLNNRIVQGSMLKFSMDNCQFDPLKRMLGYDALSPSGFYQLDLSDAKDRDTCTLLLNDAKSRKRDFIRNEKINGVRFALSADKEWKIPTEGIFECDCIVTDHPEAGTQSMDPDDFRFLCKVMEMCSGDTGRMNLLKQACRAHYLEMSMALSILFKFALDSSRESAVVVMLSHIIDPNNLFVLHAALSERSRLNLLKRIGPLYFMNRVDPAGSYCFDLTKNDDVRALRFLLSLLEKDETAKLNHVKYCVNVWETPQVITPESPLWETVFPSTTAGRAHTVPNTGLLELQYDCMRHASMVLKASTKVMAGTFVDENGSKKKLVAMPSWTRANWANPDLMRSSGKGAGSFTQQGTPVNQSTASESGDQISQDGASDWKGSTAWQQSGSSKFNASFSMVPVQDADT